MTRYKLAITKSAIRDIEKLDNVVKKKIRKKILILQENPFYNTKKLAGSIIGDYRFRVGDYRIIFDIKQKDVVILRIGHRREIYR